MGQQMDGDSRPHTKGGSRAGMVPLPQAFKNVAFRPISLLTHCRASEKT